MPVLEPTWINLIPLLVATTALLAILLLRVPAAFADRKALLDARSSGRFLERLRLDIIHQAIRREFVMVGKHLIVLGAILMSFIDRDYSPVVRNYLFMSIALLMLLNSVLDYFAQQRAMNGVIKLKPRKP